MISSTWGGRKQSQVNLKNKKKSKKEAKVKYNPKLKIVNQQGDW